MREQFECIQKLDGHHGEIWALAVSNRGNFVATGSHDKSIRLWEKTDEPVRTLLPLLSLPTDPFSCPQLFLEEERERELEELYSSNVNARADRDELRVLPSGEIDPSATAQADSTEVHKSTTETLMAGERIMEALDVSVQDQELQRAYLESGEKEAPPPRNPLFSMYGGVGPQEYVLKVVRTIPAAALHDALLVLPFGKVIQLIEHLDFWAHKVRLLSLRLEEEES